MPSTKIINVLRTDQFEDILNIFNEASAEEVIFVLPKRGKAFNTENHFAMLNVEAKERGKTVSLLCANPQINALATKFGFNVLSTGHEKKATATLAVSKVQEEDEAPNRADWPRDDVDVSQDVDAPIEPEEDPEAPQEDQPAEDAQDPETFETEDLKSTTNEDYLSFLEKPAQPTSNVPADYEVRTVAKINKTLQDVVKVENKKTAKSVKVAKKSEAPVDVEIKKSVPAKIEPTIPQRIETIVSDPKSSAKTPAPLPQKKEELNHLTEKTLDELKNVWQAQDKESKTGKASPLGLEKNYKFSSISPPVKSSAFSMNMSWFPNFFKGMSKKVLWGLAGFALVLLGVIIFVSTGSAKITIKPKEESVDFTLKVLASDKFSQVDVNSYQIPGQSFSIEKTVTDNFNATGEKDVAQKARGIITVYNAYGTAPQTLIATTRFEFQDGTNADNGLVFRTLKTITVPGMKVINGKSTPGAVDVEVIADKAGQTYNVPAGKFGIVAFREKGDLDRYAKYYGQSSAPMKGGIVGKAKVITQQDYSNAQAKVQNELNDQIAAAFRSQVADLKVLGLDKPEIKSTVSSANVDEAADSFSITIVGGLTTVGFKQTDLDALVAAYIDKTNNLYALADKLNLTFGNIKFNKDQNILGFDVVVKGVAYGKIDGNKIIADLMGKNESEIKDYIKGVDGIASARVVLSPFWVKRIPKNKDKIQLDISY